MTHPAPGRAERYFDNASTTALDPAAAAAMRPWLEGSFGNAHSLHAWGRAARDAVEAARSQVAALVGCDPEEIAFTSGASEANNWVIVRSAAVACSPFEHASVREPATAAGGRVLEPDGWELGPVPSGCQTLCVLTVSNETGAVPVLPKLPDGVFLHRDAAQSFGKLPMSQFPCDSAAFSAHKLHGPQGVGALYCAGARFPSPLLLGGGQESGRRAGTLNVAGIVGFGAACSVALERMETDYQHARKCREAVLEGLSSVPGLGISDHRENSPYILSVVLPGILGEAMVVEMDAVGFAVGSGPACSAGTAEPSPVLLAAGLSPSEARSSVRISFGRGNTLASASALGAAMASAVRRMQGIIP